MHISCRPLALALALAGLAPATALGSANQTVSNEKLKADWTGAPALGLNQSFLLDGIGGQVGTCGALTDPRTACDKTLVHLTGIVGEGSTLKFRIDGFLPVSDFDLRVYTSDETGALDSYLGSPSSTDVSETSPAGSGDPRYTGPGDYENKVVDVTPYADFETGEIDQWFAVVVPYFLTPMDSYAGHATLDAKPFVPPVEE